MKLGCWSGFEKEGCVRLNKILVILFNCGDIFLINCSLLKFVFCVRFVVLVICVVLICEGWLFLILKFRGEDLYYFK